MTETQPGRFQASTVALIDGVYPIRVAAGGVTFNGAPFTREQTLTGAVFHGGDQPLPTTPPKGHSELCCLLETLTAQDTVRRYLEQQGIDPDGIRKAISRCCKG
jgi:hypothetical protein